jgi:uncharacterized protein (DUF488 family)
MPEEVAVPDAPPTVYSIGHSNHTIERLLELLGQHAIEVVADVRTAPFSRYSTQFNKDALAASLKRQDIGYVFLGRELGGRPDGEQYYDSEGHVRYDRLSQSDLFHAGIERLQRGASEHRVAMLCSEGDPTQCHRHLLIARVLDSLGVSVVHIETDGATTTYTDAASKTPTPLSLFDGEEESQWRSPLSVSRDTAQSRISED